jgi:DNA-binding transcriptional LysR family regulator
MQRGTLDLVVAALPAAAEGLHSRALPSMPMVFVGHQALHRKRRYTLADLGELELLTFQRGSQPHVALLDQFRRCGLAPPRVHTLSSISAMVELVEGGFGVATLPQAAVQRLIERLPLRLLRCDSALVPLPVHLSWREDPTGTGVNSRLVDAVLAHAARASAGASKKSIKA